MIDPLTHPARAPKTAGKSGLCGPKTQKVSFQNIRSTPTHEDYFYYRRFEMGDKRKTLQKRVEGATEHWQKQRNKCW